MHERTWSFRHLSVIFVSFGYFATELMTTAAHCSAAAFAFRVVTRVEADYLRRIKSARYSALANMF